MTDSQSSSSSSSRRDFLKAATAAGGAITAAGLTNVPMVHAAGSDEIRVGLVGCGGRGRGAAADCAESSKGVKIVAIGDAFADRVRIAKENLSSLGGAFDIGDRAFTGLDAYKKVIDSDVNLVILATPPGFRPIHIEAVINAGKNLFTEKPVGVDGAGIRKVLAAAEKAKEKGLAAVAGTQRRHQNDYLAAMEQIHKGTIGDIVGARVYWNQGSLWKIDRSSSMSDAEWQIRNWLYFTWLSGDHIVEQHVHNLDVMNWAMRAHPVKVTGMGGREVRKDPAYGHIFDHFALEYEYPNGVIGQSYCRQIDGCEGNVSETVIGTQGVWQSGTMRITDKANGKVKWRYRGQKNRPYVQEHTDLIASIRDGKPLNELKTVAESTLTAIMGRMAAYTGKTVEWDAALNSKQVWMPEDLSMASTLPVPPVAVPGQTPLI